MSLKTELFALNYVKTAGDLTLAAEAMNITPATAKRYLRREEVQNYISDLNKDIEKVVGINKAKIVQFHLDIHERAMESDALAPANKALESVSKMLGYNDPVRISSEETVRIIAMPKETELIEAEILDFDKDDK